MKKPITFITGNIKKAELVMNFLEFPIKHKQLDLFEIQSLDLDEIIRHKAKQAYEILKNPVLVDDASLVYTAFGRLPGPFIKSFIEEIGTKGLCRILNHYSKDRSAVAEVALALYDGSSLKIFRSFCKGKISAYPKGSGGLGYDPVFMPEGSKITWAEMNEQERSKTYCRNQALKKLKSYLQTNQ